MENKKECIDLVPNIVNHDVLRDELQDDLSRVKKIMNELDAILTPQYERFLKVKEDPDFNLILTKEFIVIGTISEFLRMSQDLLYKRYDIRRCVSYAKYAEHLMKQ